MQYTVALNAAGVDRADFQAESLHGFRRRLHERFSINGERASASHFQLVLHAIRLQFAVAGTVEGRRRLAPKARKSNSKGLATPSSFAPQPHIWSWLKFATRCNSSATKVPAPRKSAEVTRERSEAGQELPLENTRSQLTLARIRQRIIRFKTAMQSFLSSSAI